MTDREHRATMPGSCSMAPIVTCRAFVELEGKFLVILAPWCNKWTLPGGRIDDTESVEETLKRELHEELGITIVDSEFLGFCHGNQAGVHLPPAAKLHFIFHVLVDKKPIVDAREAIDSKWLTLDEIRGLSGKEDFFDDLFHRYPALLL